MFIHHSNTVDVLTWLGNAITNYKIASLLGCAASGKSYVLEYLADAYWKYEKSGERKAPRVVRIELREPTGKGGGRYSTPAACIAFTEITSGLADISRHHDSELVHHTRMWYRQPQSLYSDKQFNSLFVFVRNECQRLGVTCMLVDNAHFLDTFTMQRLMDVRRLRGHQLACIFSAPIEKQGLINENLSRVLNVTTDPDDVESSVELKSLTQAETLNTVLIGLLKHLHLDFAPSLDIKEIALIRKMFWSETQGDWHAIAKRQRRLQDFLDLNRGRERFLTKEIFEKVMGKPLPIST